VEFSSILKITHFYVERLSKGERRGAPKQTCYTAGEDAAELPVEALTLGNARRSASFRGGMMILATISWGDSSSAALVLGDRIAPVRQLRNRNSACDVLSLIRAPLTKEEVHQLSALAAVDAQVRWWPPIPHPPKNVLCVGRNYFEHLKDSAKSEGVAKLDVPKAPIWFTKAPSSLLGAGGEIVLDPRFTQQLDYEGELALVMGKSCRRVSPERALDYVFGYTILNDVSAREVQLHHQQWFKGKSADTYSPCGPWIVTADQVGDPQQLDLRTTVNGEVRQQENTRSMIFSIRTLIADISAGITLEAGDIIATGTPQGVAAGMTPPRYLADGDEVVIEIEKIGRLWNRVALVKE
jgi:2-keto-4-pentenoate hydratase/2-oxohepta-3-ene-1,7-dioic acid hydratase in catechol pathway